MSSHDYGSAILSFHEIEALIDARVKQLDSKTISYNNPPLDPIIDIAKIVSVRGTRSIAIIEMIAIMKYLKEYDAYPVCIERNGVLYYIQNITRKNLNLKNVLYCDVNELVSYFAVNTGNGTDIINDVNIEPYINPRYITV